MLWPCELLLEFQESLLLGDVSSVPVEKMQALRKAYEFMDKFLEGRKWLVGDSYTLADMSCVSSLSSLSVSLRMQNAETGKSFAVLTGSN